MTDQSGDGDFVIHGSVPPLSASWTPKTLFCSFDSCTRRPSLKVRCSLLEKWALQGPIKIGVFSFQIPKALFTEVPSNRIKYALTSIANATLSTLERYCRSNLFINLVVVCSGFTNS